MAQGRGENLEGLFSLRASQEKSIMRRYHRHYPWACKLNGTFEPSLDPPDEREEPEEADIEPTDEQRESFQAAIGKSNLL